MASTAAAVVLLYRLAGYWLLVLVGGVAAALTDAVARGLDREPLQDGGPT